MVKRLFFEYYADDFRMIYEQNKSFLWDINLSFLECCLNLLDESPKYKLSDKYVDLSDSPEYLNLRSSIHPKKKSDLNGLFDIPSYQQVFGKAFVSNLSIIDLIFCEGPNANFVLKQSLNISPTK
ncbi:MAG: WbqC family protein [Bacteroidia bacterium]|nr:WbqC family protein [Bacteroidia bacterium]